MNKTKRLEIRVSPKEYKEIAKNAKQAQVSISRYVAVAASRWIGTFVFEAPLTSQKNSV